MAFNGTEGAQISLSTGSALTAEYRAQNPGETKGHFYGKDILNDLLDQSGCMGIRIYYGIDGDGNKELVLVGADQEECDLTDLVVDVSSPCPNRCSKENDLNS
ncbi:MAG: hypothetical protein ACJASQ_000926 [Crocinitomicaceae bacterium]|jgi:hypothetical protein